MLCVLCCVLPNTNANTNNDYLRLTTTIVVCVRACVPGPSLVSSAVCVVLCVDCSACGVWCVACGVWCVPEIVCVCERQRDSARESARGLVSGTRAHESVWLV